MAGKIPKSFIDQLLSQADIVDVIGQHVTLKKTGHNYSACCPFHDEKTPSFSVSPNKQFYYCFGCGASGDAIKFVQEYNHLSFVEAVETMARQMGLDVPYEQSQDPHYQERQSEFSQMYGLMDKALQFYQAELKAPAGKIAQDYCKERGLSGSIAKAYGLGFAPAGWDNLLLHLNHKQHQTKTDQLLKVGLLTTNDNGKIYDKFRDRLMFPIRDNRGRTIAFGGRVFEKDAKPKYLNSPESPIFHKSNVLYGLYEAKQALKKIDSLIVVEGYMDVIALAQSGIHNAVAAMGTATTPEHLRLLFKETDTVTFCFDGDRAGKQAAWRALTTALPLMTGEYLVRFLFLPDGEDPDTMVRQHGKIAFEKSLQNALSLGEFLLATLAKDYDLTRADARAQYLSRLLPYIKQIPQGSFQIALINRLSEKTHIPANQIQMQLIGKANTQGAGSRAQPKTNIKGRTLSLAEQAMYYLLTEPSLMSDVTAPTHLSKDESTQLLNQLMLFLQAEHPKSTAAVLRHWPHGDKSQQMLAQIASNPTDIGHIVCAQTIQDVLNKLAHANQQTQLDALLFKSKHATLTTDEKSQLSALFQQLR